MKKIFLILLITFVLLITIIINIAFAVPEEAEHHSFKEKIKEGIIQFLQDKGIPKEIIVITIAMLPIFELRGAIPISHQFFGITWWFTFILAFIGNMIPVP